MSKVYTLKGGQSGLVLVETVVAFGVLSLVVISLLSGLITSSKATMTAKEQAIAESLGRSQLEYVKSNSFDNLGNYPIDPSITMPDGWTVPPPEVELVHDTNIQKITVTPERNGRPILSFSMYKVNR